MSKSIAFLSLERRIDAMFARYTKPGSPGAVEVPGAPQHAHHDLA